MLCWVYYDGSKGELLQVEDEFKEIDKSAPKIVFLADRHVGQRHEFTEGLQSFVNLLVFWVLQHECVTLRESSI